MADRYLLAYGDPYLETRWHDEIVDESKVIDTFAKYMGVNDPHGYVTSGGTESNFACIWWCQSYL